MFRYIRNDCSGVFGIRAQFRRNMHVVPQIRQNYKLQNVFSLKVPTEGLMLWQLGTGVSTARYATYVGDKSAYKYAGMYFIDRI